ncbi:hypothetical protein BLS_000632 [Venturia inaequalis]|uniref:Uncharacterized protein n=1 Tax=Venturia inaequalis TaxID=5025 RepID=A0A8H3U3D0_VENIN|nr:hypothetical protein BLS_000632 [Venturia inaequalis]KAE9971426.1 hypothetical protein EG328_005572 [Venturia inaequalis]
MPTDTTNQYPANDGEAKDADPPRNPIGSTERNFRQASQKKQSPDNTPAANLAGTARQDIAPTASQCSSAFADPRSLPQSSEMLPTNNNPALEFMHANAFESCEINGWDLNQDHGGDERSEMVRKEGNEATNGGEKGTPFDRWLEESKQDSPWYCLGIDEVQLFREADSNSAEEGGGDTEA